MMKLNTSLHVKRLIIFSVRFFRMNSYFPPPPPMMLPQMPFVSNSRFSVAGSSSASSEISSIESDFSDLKSIAAGLGIVDLEEVFMERFKIDRLKLEDMIKSKMDCIIFIKEVSKFNFYSWSLLWWIKSSRILFCNCKLINNWNFLNFYFVTSPTADERKPCACFMALSIKDWSKDAQRWVKW